METLNDVPKDISILVIDDIPSARGVVTRLLKNLGFTNVDELGNGSAALEMLGKKEFDLVISDLHLKDMLGTDLLEQARKEEANKDLPFVIMTSDMSRESFEKVQKKRSITYLLKPFNRGRLAEKITEVLIPPDEGF
jgi:two-component system chemotaxis response regulator CheY